MIFGLLFFLVIGVGGVALLAAFIAGCILAFKCSRDKNWTTGKGFLALFLLVPLPCAVATVVALVGWNWVGKSHGSSSHSFSTELEYETFQEIPSDSPIQSTETTIE